MTVCLLMYLIALHKHCWLVLPQKNQVRLIPLNFERDLDHLVNTQKKIIRSFLFTYYNMSWWRYVLFKCSCIVCYIPVPYAQNVIVRASRFVTREAAMACPVEKCRKTCKTQFRVKRQVVLWLNFNSE